MIGLRVGVVIAIYALSFGCGNAKDVQVDASVDAPSDASVTIDAPPDVAIPAAGFDIGFVDNYTVTPDVNAVFGFAAVVNTGMAPLDLSTARVVSFSDDAPNIDTRFEVETPSTATITTGRAGGYLTITSKSKVLQPGVITETFDDTVLSFGVVFITPLNIGNSVQVQAVIEISGLTVTLPIKITVGAGQMATSAKRLSAQ